MLTADELREALRTRLDVRRTVTRRKAEHAWVRGNPGPMTYGPEPGKAPDLRGLPAPARRINRALLWMMEHELTAQGQRELNRGPWRVVRRVPRAGQSDQDRRTAAHAASRRGIGVSDDVGRLDDGVSPRGCDRCRNRQRVVAYVDCRPRVRASGRRGGGECDVQPGGRGRGDGRWDPRRGHPLLTGLRLRRLEAISRSRSIRRFWGAIDHLRKATHEVHRCASRLARSMDFQGTPCRFDLTNELAGFLKRRGSGCKVERVRTNAAGTQCCGYAPVARAWRRVRRQPAIRARERLDRRTRVLEPFAKELTADRQCLGRLRPWQVEDLSEDVCQPMRSVEALQHAERAPDLYFLG